MDSPSDTNSSPFLQDALVKFTQLMTDDAEMETNYHAPYWVYQTKPNCRCPACGVDMLIAGWYDKSQSTLNGVSQCQHECIKCGKRVTPVKIS